MKKIFESSLPVPEDKSQEKDIEMVIGERVKRVKNFMGGLSEIKGFSLYDIIISEVERALISSVLSETRGNQLKASRVLGINRNTLRKKIRDLKI